jgi:aspartate/glutamate racemase
MQTVNGGTEGRERLTKIAHELAVDAVVLAGTDLSLVFDESNIDFPYVDCTQVHLRAIAKALA